MSENKTYKVQQQRMLPETVVASDIREAWGKLHAKLGEVAQLVPNSDPPGSIPVFTFVEGDKQIIIDVVPADDGNGMCQHVRFWLDGVFQGHVSFRSNYVLWNYTADCQVGYERVGSSKYRRNSNPGVL